MSGLIYKSIQYSVYCYSCDELEDYEEFNNQKEAESVYRARGWQKTESGWQCPACNGQVRKDVRRDNPLIKKLTNTKSVSINDVMNRK